MGLYWPLLSPDEITGQASLASEWQIPSGLLPFIGDMHSLVCLDYRQGDNPSVVYLNDAREITPLFGCLSDFIAARTEPIETSSGSTGIVSGWLDF
jgi:hypothetical protein